MWPMSSWIAASSFLDALNVLGDRAEAQNASSITDPANTIRRTFIPIPTLHPPEPKRPSLRPVPPLGSAGGAGAGQSASADALIGSESLSVQRCAGARVRWGIDSIGMVRVPLHPTVVYTRLPEPGKRPGRDRGRSDTVGLRTGRERD